MEQNKKKKERATFIRVAILNNCNNLRSLFVGPFANEAEAQGFKESMGEKINPNELSLTYIGKTEAIREGMKFYLDEIPQIENWISIFESHEADPYESNRGRPSKGEGKKVKIDSTSKTKTNRRIPHFSPTNSYASSIKRIAKMLGPKKVIITTKSSNVVNWLGRYGISGEIEFNIAYPNQIEGKVIIGFGVVPPCLSCFADMFGVINITGVTKEDAERLTPDEMDRMNAHIDLYRTIKLDEGIE